MESSSSSALLTGGRLTGAFVGLFAPMLVLGAQFGFLSGGVCRILLPYRGLRSSAWAAFFTGAVRAPITRIVLATEMTGSVSMLLPMLRACAVAMLAPTLMGDPPIYASLQEQALPLDGPTTRHPEAGVFKPNCNCQRYQESGNWRKEFHVGRSLNGGGKWAIPIGSLNRPRRKPTSTGAVPWNCTPSFKRLGL
jgi:Voltage gated chloride channel